LIIHEIKGEKKYDLNTCRINNLTQSVPGYLLKHASIYQPVNFFIAEWLFEQVPEYLKKTVFFDIGCGMGRVLVMALHKNFKTVAGIDVSPEMCHDAAILLADKVKKYPGSTYSISCENAQEMTITEETGVIFLFNPFDEYIMAGLIAQVRLSIFKKPRKLMVLYASPLHKSLWIEAGFFETGSIKKLRWLEGSVLVFDPDNLITKKSTHPDI
jgi:SAM-dependent methyltransferase